MFLVQILLKKTVQLVEFLWQRVFASFLQSAEIPEKRKITGDHPCSLKAFARTGANEEPSSVIKQRGFSGSSACSTSGEASGTT